ncbi:MAG: beta-lactamase family protein [Emcibacteraceae bacterium]|nr:beta-lactamase family protein [Emcibacteraceae bacterium]
MKIINAIKLGFMFMCLALFTTTSVNALDISDLDDPKVAEAFIDGLVLPMMKTEHSAAGTVGIVKDGKVILNKGYGYQNIKDHILINAETTLMRPGSVSKLFTWVAVMQMVEQGKLDLDVDVNNYLDNFKIKDTYPGKPVTMRHIMTHSAGFEDGAMGYLIKTDPASIIPLADSMKKYQPARVNPPGAQTAYSNYATGVAGLIVANLSGLDFNSYIKQNIFDVIGMNNSSFAEPLPADLNENMAMSYTFSAEQYAEKAFEIIANFGPAGSLSSTSSDMLKFGLAILNGGEYEGGRILKQETVEQMLTRNFSHDDRLMGMALGFYETDLGGTRLVGHGGDTMHFHSNLAIDIENNMVIYTSFGGGGGSKIRTALTPAIYDAFSPRATEVITPPADFADRAEKYAGNYSFWRGNFSSIEKAMGMMGGIPVIATPDNTLIVILGPYGGEYVEIEHNLFQRVNGYSKLAFQENDNGDITGFVLDGMPFMSTYKAAAYSTANFNFSLLGFSLLIFAGVVLRRLYQWSRFKSLPRGEKKAANASMIVSSANLLVFILGTIMMIIVQDQIFTQIPFLLKLWLILPIIATVAGFYHAYNAVLVWKDDIGGSVWAKLRYSVISICGLMLCWFYYYRNILGFQYFG